MKKPPHPGDLIKTEVVEALRLSVTKASEILKVRRAALSDLLHGKTALTPEMALRIEKAFGPDMSHLLRMQLAYDVAKTKEHARDLALERYSAERQSSDFVTQPRGQWGWQLYLSSPERAILELLDELPDRGSFHQVDELFEGLANLSPRQLENLLGRCKNVKVKRLFLYFADRHKHAWLKRVNRSAADLGKGKRLLVRGGKLDPTYHITVPEDVDATE